MTRFTSGTSWNIIPETARLEGTVRTFNPKVREQIVELMQAQAEGLEREGYQVEFTWIPGCPATNNDANLAELVRKEAMEEVRAKGSDRRNSGGFKGNGPKHHRHLKQHVGKQA